MSENNNFDCVICFESKSNNEKILSPCAHGPYCEPCYNNLTRSTGICAICRHILNPTQSTRIHRTNANTRSSRHINSTLINSDYTSLSTQNPLPNALNSIISIGDNQNNIQNQFLITNNQNINLTISEPNRIRLTGVSPFNSTFMSMIRDMQQNDSNNGFANNRFRS